MAGRARYFHSIAAVLCAALLLSACTTSRQTEPQRTATEQLIISSAVDRMVKAMQIDIPPGTKVFVDTQYFEALDGKYTIAAIRDRLLRSGVRLAADRKSADMVVELRSGAQSIDKSEFLVGVPKTAIPVPFSGSLTIPEIALFKREQRKGVVKTAITGYDEKDGSLRLSTGPVYGYSHSTDWTVLLLISWTTEDYLPKAQQGSSGPLVEAPVFP